MAAWGADTEQDLAVALCIEVNGSSVLREKPQTGMFSKELRRQVCQERRRSTCINGTGIQNSRSLLRLLKTSIACVLRLISSINIVP